MRGKRANKSGGSMMGMQRAPTTLPDTTGLPEFFISDVVTEIDGPNVRMICGIRRGGIVHWLYSCVMQADKLAISGRQVTNAALEARDLAEFIGSNRH
jgi:hypothetical protein